MFTAIPHTGVVNTALLLYFYHHLDHPPSTYLFVFGIFRYATSSGLEDGQVTSLTLFRFIYFVPDISHWVHIFFRPPLSRTCCLDAWWFVFLL
jgi:hypothetical protein